MIMDKQFSTVQLPCGLRVIHQTNSSPVLYCGYVVSAGTRNERNDEAGMAHFIEHMSFKGTMRRRANHIINGLERVGGELNAYTTKQETVYHATVLRSDFQRAADLLTDIVFHSTYPQAEINKEVEVICDEIDSYRDTPSDLIFDEFEQMLYPTHPLGRDILGDKDRLRQYTTADAAEFAKRWYRPDNATFFVYGDIPFAQVVRTLNKLFSLFPPLICKIEKPVFASCVQPRCEGVERVVEKSTHQAHVMLGAPAFAGRDERRYALILLNNLLGGPGMNSRLNLSLRERKGLVYSVDSYLNTYPDTGYWNIYFGCDPHDVARCIRLVKRELARLAEKPLSSAQLRAAKRQLCGQIGISTSLNESYALTMGKLYALYGEVYDVERLCKQVQAVTAEQLRQVAEEVYNPERVSTLIYR